MTTIEVTEKVISCNRCKKPVPKFRADTSQEVLDRHEYACNLYRTLSHIDDEGNMREVPEDEEPPDLCRFCEVAVISHYNQSLTVRKVNRRRAEPSKQVPTTEVDLKVGKGHKGKVHD